MSENERSAGTTLGRLTIGQARPATHKSPDKLMGAFIMASPSVKK